MNLTWLENTFFDLSTKRSVAFYAGLAVTLYDIVKNHFSNLNLAALIILAGLGTGDVVLGAMKK